MTAEAPIHLPFHRSHPSLPVAIPDSSPRRQTYMATEPNAANFLSLARAVLHSNLGHIADLVGHIEITLQDVTYSRYRLELFVGNQKVELKEVGNQTWDRNQTWRPVQRSDMPPTSEIRVDVKRTTSLPFLAKRRQTNEVIDLQALFKVYWASNMREFTVPMNMVIGKNHVHLELRFFANRTAESLRSSIRELEELMKGYTSMMSRVMGTALGNGNKLFVLFYKFDPIAKAVLGVAKVIFELMKEQNKDDQMPSSLLDQLQRILPLVDKDPEEIVVEETEILDTIVPRMFEVIQKIAKFLCDYVKRGYFKRTGVALFSSKDKDSMKEMDEELAIVIKDFLNALNAKALHRARRLEHNLLLKRLKPIETAYHWEFGLGCMPGTRRSRLEEIENWVANKPEGEDLIQSNTYWIYGSPGIGKTSLAHSICTHLLNRWQLAGAFFCRRDDPNLSEPKNILPTLIYKLAERIPPFRKIVANYLRSDPFLTPELMEDSLFLEFLDKLPHGPNKSLAYVIELQPSQPLVLLGV